MARGAHPGHPPRVEAGGGSAVSAAFPADGTAVIRLRAESLTGGRIEYAIAGDHLRGAVRTEKPRDGRRSPPERGAAIDPEEPPIAAESDQSPMLVRVAGLQRRIAIDLRTTRVAGNVIRIPAARDEADLAGAHAVAGGNPGVAVHALLHVRPHVVGGGPDR